MIFTTQTRLAEHSRFGSYPGALIGRALTDHTPTEESPFPSIETAAELIGLTADDLTGTDGGCYFISYFFGGKVVSFIADSVQAEQALDAVRGF